MTAFLPWIDRMIAAGVFAAFTGPALAAQNCAPRDVVVTRLAEIFGESRQSVGLGTNDAVMEVFASPDTGTWTITITSPNGVTCLVASGEAFETMAAMLPVRGKDA